jgi:hypothetical protein
MNWLKDNVYVAAWLALPVMVMIAFIQGRPTIQTETQRETFPLKKSLTYLLFLICFPLALTPWVEAAARALCTVASVVLFLIIAFRPDKDWAD